MVKMSDGGLTALSDLQNIDISLMPDVLFLVSCLLPLASKFPLFPFFPL